MTERKAYLVVGPESSGTRMTTGLFLSAGCAGSDEHLQPMDEWLDGSKSLEDVTGGDPEKIVIRRSVPWGSESKPALDSVVSVLEARGWDVTVIAIVRDEHCLAYSKVGQGHQKAVGEGFEAIPGHYRHIFRFLADTGVKFHVLDTSLVMERPGLALRGIERSTGLKFNTQAVSNEDIKHG